MDPVFLIAMVFLCSCGFLVYAVEMLYVHFTREPISPDYARITRLERELMGDRGELTGWTVDMPPAQASPSGRVLLLPKGIEAEQTPGVASRVWYGAQPPTDPYEGDLWIKLPVDYPDWNIALLENLANLRPSPFPNDPRLPGGYQPRGPQLDPTQIVKPGQPASALTAGLERRDV